MQTNSPVKGLLFLAYTNIWGYLPRKSRLKQDYPKFTLQVSRHAAESAEV